MSTSVPQIQFTDAGLIIPTVAAILAGTKHDLSQKGFNTTQICIFCHTPHNANAYVPGSPLWNHNVTWSTFTTYASPTLNAVPGQPTGTSKLCLSCHDGTVGIDAYTNNAGLNFITGTALLGTDLSNDHPVSFLYDAADGIIIPPGGYIAIGSTAAQGGFLGSFAWEEIKG